MKISHLVVEHHDIPAAVWATWNPSKKKEKIPQSCKLLRRRKCQRPHTQKEIINCTKGCSQRSINNITMNFMNTRETSANLISISQIVCSYTWCWQISGHLQQQRCLSKQVMTYTSCIILGVEYYITRPWIGTTLILRRSWSG